MSYEDLLSVIDDVNKAPFVWEVADEVKEYSQFKMAIDLGLTVGINDLPFEKAMVFSWIKESIK